MAARSINVDKTTHTPLHYDHVCNHRFTRPEGVLWYLTPDTRGTSFQSWGCEVGSPWIGHMVWTDYEGFGQEHPRRPEVVQTLLSSQCGSRQSCPDPYVWVFSRMWNTKFKDKWNSPQASVAIILWLTGENVLQFSDIVEYYSSWPKQTSNWKVNN